MTYSTPLLLGMLARLATMRCGSLGKAQRDKEEG
jgi:hypothetical protein